MTHEWLTPERVSESDVEDINALLPQLTETPKTLFYDRVVELAQKTKWCVIRDDEGRIRGMGTLNSFPIPTGDIIRFDDFVVDEPFRRDGLPDKLYNEIMSFAECRLPGKQVDFTCNPNRERANKLYVRNGAILRPTNNYFFKFRKFR